MSANRNERSGGDRFGNDETLPKLYDILTGIVTSIQAYGAFIKFPGRRKNGLVHKSQISKIPVEDPAEVLEIGEEVRVKVISHGEDGTKIALSMKHVNQRTGEDLDASNVQLTMEEQRRRTGIKRGDQKIELGAVLNTTCKKCGGKGHFTQECFRKSGEKESYDLLPDIDDMVKKEKEDGICSESAKKKKKKKEKKHKKKKKHRKKESDSEGESEDDIKAKKEKKHKSHKRQRKESAETSDSSSESDDQRGWRKSQGKSHTEERSRDDRPNNEDRAFSDKRHGNNSHEAQFWKKSKPDSKNYSHENERHKERHDERHDERHGNQSRDRVHDRSPHGRYQDRSRHDGSRHDGSRERSKDRSRDKTERLVSDSASRR